MSEYPKWKGCLKKALPWKFKQDDLKDIRITELEAEVAFMKSQGRMTRFDVCILKTIADHPNLNERSYMALNQFIRRIEKGGE